MSKKVCVLLEAGDDGGLKDVGYELLNEAVSFSNDFGARVFAVLIGGDSEKAVAEAKGYGVERLHVLDSTIDPGQVGANDSKFRNICDLLGAESPALVLMEEEYAGINLASFLSVLHGYKVVSNVQRIAYVDRNIRVEKPVFNGRLLKTLTYSPIQRLAVLFRAGTMGVGNPLKKTQDISLARLADGQESGAARQFEGVTQERSYQVELTDLIAEADIVIGVGAGVAPELIKDIERLAKRLNAAVGGTRVSVDRGLVPYEKQIGQTGRSIAPKIYMALGISGAIQHLVGMRNAKFIIAVNRDKNAPIMKIADLACVSNVEDLVPELFKCLKAQA